MKRIMIVDDDAEAAKELKAKIEATGRFSAVVALGGRIGLALAQTDHPDLILCDVDMPDMDGSQVAHAIASKEEIKHIPVVFLTTSFTTDEAGKLGQTSPTQIVSKQAPIEDLIQKIDEVTAGE